MKTNPWPMLTLILAVSMIFLIRHEESVITERQRTIDALIDLNHDKSVYIDAGCRGQYQGTEEMLPSEAEVRP